MLALILSLLLAAPPVHMNDQADVALTAEEKNLSGPAGINVGVDERHFPAYIMVDASGLTAPQKQALRDALDCTNVDQNSSKRKRLACIIGYYKHGKWYSHNDRHVAYVYMPRKWLKKLKGLSDSRVQVFAGRWNLVAAHAQCANFFGASCGVGADPDGAGPLEPEALNPPPHPVPYGVDPNRGKPVADTIP